MTNVRRVLLCCGVVLFGAHAWADEIRNWTAPPYWGGPVRAKVPEESPGGVATEAAEGLPTVPVPFVAIVPCRVVDTRGNGFTGAYGPPALVGNAAARAFNVPAGPCPGIPADAAAFSINIGAILPAADGFLTAFPTGGALPTVSNVNFLANEVIANSAVIGAGTSGSISIFVNVTTHVIIDINGYYTGSAVTSVTPATGLTGGGAGAVTIGIANGGVGTTQLADGAVTSSKIGANAVTAGAIAPNQVVKSLNGLHDAVTLVGSGGTTVTPGVGTITISSSGGGGSAPAGSFILGNPGDSTIIGAGYTEVGASNVDLWSATATSGAPTGRFAHTAVWTGTRMIVWGGTPDNVANLNTGGRYDPVTDSWTATTTTGAPTGRRYHTAVWTGSKMIAWGGFDGTTPFDTGGQYDPVADSWTATTTTGAPTGRFRHTAVWTGSRMVVWGGNADSPNSNTGGRYDPAGNSWQSTTTTGAPSGRELHTAVWTGTQIIVWGGWNSATNTYFDTGGRYDPAGDSWSAMAAFLFQNRSQHTSVWTGSSMIIWGGYSGSIFLNTGGIYDPVGNSWNTISGTGAPAARINHTAVWTGSRMIVWGGTTSTGSANSGGHFDLVSFAWALGGTTTIGAPSARYGHTAVWTGTQMVVWGGISGAGLNTGGRYTLLSLYLKN
jgi:N-acetylneuraminic acid mutarotase